MVTRRFLVPALVFATVILGVVGFGQPATSNNGFTLGTPTTGAKGISRTNAEIMAVEKVREPRKNILIKHEFEIPGRRNRPQNPAAGLNPQIAPGTAKKSSTSGPGQIAGPKFSQTIGLQWDGVTGPTQTNAFPPDSMGAVGPTQFVI